MSTISSGRGPSGTYALGHDDHELERLSAQARLIDPITRHYFCEAGLVAGMRVLDVGSGAGDVALLAAELVGENGEVIGVDRSAAALELARSRSERRANVCFREGDPLQMSFERSFDAIVGRYVIQFQPDPAPMLRHLASFLRPGGLMIFQETDWFTAQSFPSAPLHDSCCRWIVQTMKNLGAEMNMGRKLYAAFVAAGLPEPTMRMQTLISGGRNSFDRLDMVVDLVNTLFEPMVQSGVATIDDVGLESLSERLREEVLTQGSVVLAHADVGAWIRL